MTVLFFAGARELGASLLRLMAGVVWVMRLMGLWGRLAGVLGCLLV